jgi:hypothetical protein
MAAERYRFHCTDGQHVVLDRAGKRLKDGGLVYAYAARTALEVMASCGGRLGWSDWIVDVHDAKGRRVLILAFSDVHASRKAA